ncbi:MAG: 2Fe-2S iron-sulfur cluster binding domain-containing protein [Bacteroidetes bacterium]|nr:2Fe-2S iron-sulfur cluster binding domain-containing protein [Bacteroidota bacterium]
MEEQRKSIRLTVVQDGERTVIETHAHAYRNLMVLLNNHCYLENFGECGGMGRCATCVVHTQHPALQEHNRNEASTLAKLPSGKPGTRLSCQIHINELLDGADININSQDFY